jgi:lipid A 3-O-deacylase
LIALKSQPEEPPVKRVTRLACAASAALVAATPAQASEIFGGLFVHDVDTFLTLSGVEDGFDAQLGWRGGRIGGTPLQPYVFVSAHSKGQTHFAAAGLSAKFGDSIFIRPGLGIAVHTGNAGDFQDPTNDEVELGSRILFEPELGIGARINERLSIEASWVHLSQGQLFGRQNPGMDNLGVRLTVELP